LAELITTSGTFAIGSADTFGTPATAGGAPPPPAISAGVTLTPPASGFGPTSAPFSEETAKICSSFELPGSIKGSTASIKFTLVDFGDSIVDSGVLIDDVKFDIGGSASGSTGHEPPTIGKSLDGIRQVVDCGIAIDGQCRTVTSPFHEEMELLQMFTSPHTISNTIFCDKGVQYCNYIAVGFMALDDDFNNPVMTVAAAKDHLGDWTLRWDDPQDFIHDPSDSISGDITFVPQIIDNRLLGTSFTIDFKNKDTGQLKLGIQVRDSYNGVRNFYFNEGVEFIDADAYPAVQASYEAPIVVEPLCFGNNNPDRNSCAFAKMKDWATSNAEQVLQNMLKGNHIYN